VGGGKPNHEGIGKYITKCADGGGFCPLPSLFLAFLGVLYDKGIYIANILAGMINSPLIRQMIWNAFCNIKFAYDGELVIAGILPIISSSGYLELWL